MGRIFYEVIEQSNSLFHRTRKRRQQFAIVQPQPVDRQLIEMQLPLSVGRETTIPPGRGNLDRSMLGEAKVAVSPGVGFGESGEGFVRFALVENRHRIRQAVRGIRRFLRDARES